MRLRVPDRDENGKETGTYHVVTYRKRANMPDFQAIQRREAVTACLELQKPAPRLLTQRGQEVKAEKGDERMRGQAATTERLLSLKTKLSGYNTV